MARLRVADLDPGDMPAPFLDPAAPEWHDPDLFATFAALLGFEAGVPPAGYVARCGRRRQMLVTAWAMDHGYRSVRWPSRLDHARLQDAGVTSLRNYGRCPHSKPPRPRRRRAAAPAPMS